MGDGLPHAIAARYRKPDSSFSARHSTGTVVRDTVTPSPATQTHNRAQCSQSENGRSNHSSLDVCTKAPRSCISRVRRSLSSRPARAPGALTMVTTASPIASGFSFSTCNARGSNVGLPSGRALDGLVFGSLLTHAQGRVVSVHGGRAPPARHLLGLALAVHSVPPVVDLVAPGHGRQRHVLRRS